jgi:hypothetical protein
MEKEVGREKEEEPSCQEAMDTMDKFVPGVRNEFSPVAARTKPPYSGTILAFLTPSPVHYESYFTPILPSTGICPIAQYSLLQPCIEPSNSLKICFLLCIALYLVRYVCACPKTMRYTSVQTGLIGDLDLLQNGFCDLSFFCSKHGINFC